MGTPVGFGAVVDDYAEGLGFDVDFFKGVGYSLDQSFLLFGCSPFPHLNNDYGQVLFRLSRGASIRPYLACDRS